MQPIVIAHRGAAAHDPENSLAAFRKAVLLGAQGIELDIRATADGKLAVVHDPVVGGLSIAQHDWEQVRQHRLSNGEPVPSLEEALDAIGRETLVFVELKALPPFCDEVLFSTLQAGPAPSNYQVHSFDHRVIRRLREKKPTLTCGILSSSYPVDPLRQVFDALASALWQEDSVIDAELVARAQQSRVSVYAWTVDDAERMKLLARWGVSGICTNRPELGLEVLA